MFRYNPITATLDLVGNSNGITGPGSSTDNAIVRWNGTSGTVVQNSKPIVQDGGAICALAYISESNINDFIDVPDTKVMISSSLNIVSGGVIHLGSGSKLIIL